MKKLSLIILLLSLVCCAVLFTACDTSTECPDGHTPATLEAVAPTCTEDGLTEGSYCSVCNTVITAQTKVPATGHSERWFTQLEVTCTADGIRYKGCDVCKVTLSEPTIVSHTGHEYGAWKTVEAASCKTGK